MVAEGLKLNNSKRTKVVRVSLNTIWCFWPYALSVEGAGDKIGHQKNRSWSFVRAVCLQQNLQLLFLNTLPHNLLKQWILVELTSDELNAMWYACGYVPRSLLKIYETKCGDMYSQYFQYLGDMAVEGDDIWGRGLIRLIKVVYTLLMAIKIHFPSLLKLKNVYTRFY